DLLVVQLRLGVGPVHDELDVVGAELEETERLERQLGVLDGRKVHVDQHHDVVGLLDERQDQLVEHRRRVDDDVVVVLFEDVEHLHQAGGRDVVGERRLERRRQDLETARVLGQQRVEELGVEVMQLVGRVHHCETGLELEHQADVSELEVGVHQHNLLVRETIEKEGEVGRQHGLAAAALGRHHGDDATFLTTWRTSGSRTTAEDVVGELLDRRLDLLLVERGLDDVGHPGPHAPPQEVGGDLVGHQHQHHGRVGVVEAADLVHVGFRVKARAQEDHPDRTGLDGGQGLLDGAGNRKSAVEQLLRPGNEVVVWIDDQEIVLCNRHPATSYRFLSVTEDLLDQVATEQVVDDDTIGLDLDEVVGDRKSTRL